MITPIPAIDIIDGKCVRLVKGDYASRTCYGDPVALAEGFAKTGFKRLHVVDLDGAKASHIVNTATLRAIVQATGMTVDFGGGIKSSADIEAAFEAGAAMVTVGSLAVDSQQTVLQWASQYGAHRIIIGADVRQGRIATHGWTKDSDTELMPFLKSYAQHGLCQVLCTDISRDGTLQGPAVELYRQIKSELPQVEIIASGGVASIDDIRLLGDSGVDAVVFGKAIYEGKIDMQQLWHWLNA